MIQRYAQFWLFKKESRNYFSTTFYGFSRKMFLILYFIHWPNFFVWLPLLLEILGNMHTAIVCFPGFDVINFEINLTFLIKWLFYMTKNSRQKFEYLENKKSLGGEIRSIFHYFHRAFSGQNCLRPERAPLIAFCNTFSGCYHCTSLSEYYIINH